MVPQPHVVDRLRVVGDVGQRERGVARHVALLDPVEVEGGPRRRDVPRDVRRLLLLLVRGHDELLHRDGQPAACDPHDQIAGGGRRHGPQRRGDGRVDGGGRPDARHDQQRLQHRQAHHLVRVRCAVDDARRRDQHAGHVEPGAGRQQQEAAGDQRGQMLPRTAAHLESLRGQPELPADDVEGARADQRQADHRQQEQADRVEQRQGEDVEARIPPEQRVGLPERRRVEELQQHEPLPGRRAREEQRQQRRGAGRQPAQVARLENDRLNVAAAGKHHVRLALGARGQSQVAEQDQERGREDADAHQALRRQALEEDRLVAGLAEPQPLGVQVRERRQRDQQQQGGDGEDDSHWHGRLASPSF